jgi:hypothetical protein
MEAYLIEFCYDVEKAIDLAFQGSFVLKFYDYLKIKGAKKRDVDEFISSSTAISIKDTVNELSEYLEGGMDNNHKQLREAYGHISKPQARKIRNYLDSIMQDARRYSDDKKPGRKRKAIVDK